MDAISKPLATLLAKYSAKLLLLISGDFNAIDAS